MTITLFKANQILSIKTHRKSQKSQEKRHLCIQQAFCNTLAKALYNSARCI